MSDVVDMHLEPDKVLAMANAIETELDAIIDPPIPCAPTLERALFETVYDVLEEFRCGSRTLRSAFDTALFSVRKTVERAVEDDAKLGHEFDGISGGGNE